jgi:Pyridoxamine 5'-phosphate oxidase
MSTSTGYMGANAGAGNEKRTRETLTGEGREEPRLTSEQVWRGLAKASFAVLSYVTPAGEPRSSGVVYKAIGRRLYVGVAPDSWKAKHVAAAGRVAVTVPVRRGGLLSLAPFPPATISFHGAAIVHPAGSPQASALLKQLGSLIPKQRRACDSVIEILPEGAFLTYGVGVSLLKMLDVMAALARVPVTTEGGT